MTTLRRMTVSELDRISEIDRSERINEEYRLRRGSLQLIDVDVHAERWRATGTGDHSVHQKIGAWRPLLERGGALVGAFEGDRLVGFAIYDPGGLAEGVANLAVLHVTKTHRRKGIGGLLTDEVVRLASADGAERLYVSATPTRATVDFYVKHGFEWLATPNETLFAMEPDDIHMDRRV